MGCLLEFARIEVLLRLVKWLASRFDVPSSEFQLKKKFIPMTKYDIHGILDLPVDGEPLVCDPESGRDFILSHFKVTSIPPVSFANKLKSTEVELPDEDVFICFMIVAFSSFLCPNSSLSPSPKYLHIFRDCPSVRNYDLSKFVYEWLLSCIKKFKDSTKVASKRSVTFGGCHYAFAVCYLDHLNFGLHSVPDVKPQILAWRGNKVKQFSDLDRNNSRSFGKRPLKQLCPSVHPQSNEKSSASKDGDVPLCNAKLFEMNVQKSFGARFGLEAAQVVIDLVQSRNKDKPKLFVEWSESLVIDVLDCIANSALNVKSIATPKFSPSDVQSLNNFSFGNKSVSIHSFIPKRNIETVVEKPSSQVQPPIPNLNEPSTFAAGVILDGDFLNPVVLSSSSPVPKSVVNEANAEGAIPMAPLSCTKSAFDAIGVSPSTMQCPIPDVGSSLMQSGGPEKNCEPKVVVNDFQKPSFAEFSRSLGVQSHPEDSIEQHKVKDGVSYVGGLSPLVPTRLTQRFRDVIDDVECCQYNVERFLSSIDPAKDEDCIEMVNLPPSEVSKSNFYSSHLNDQGVDDVQIVGTSSFVARCKDLSRSTDAAYNKLNNFNLTEPESSSHYPKNQKLLLVQK
uniref:Uncharacterized protein n=1 Tax=Triticum urartu TaxID=4572 RepID=A0A8R7V182_TRIUA